METFQVQRWVCDYGIYDIESKCFVGDPIGLFNDALTICIWLNESNRNSDGYDMNPQNLMSSSSL